MLSNTIAMAKGSNVEEYFLGNELYRRKRVIKHGKQPCEIERERWWRREKGDALISQLDPLPKT